MVVVLDVVVVAAIVVEGGVAEKEVVVLLSNEVAEDDVDDGFAVVDDNSRVPVFYLNTWEADNVDRPGMWWEVVVVDGRIMMVKIAKVSRLHCRPGDAEDPETCYRLLR